MPQIPIPSEKYKERKATFADSNEIKMYLFGKPLSRQSREKAKTQLGSGLGEAMQKKSERCPSRSPYDKS